MPRRANSVARQQTAAATSSTNAPWQLQNTENFCICCPSAMNSAAIGRTCELLRERLTGKWLGDRKQPWPWTARCYVVVHPTFASYLR
jgi:hypothetical protein